jgi:hypothetical protein
MSEVTSLTQLAKFMGQAAAPSRDRLGNTDGNLMRKPHRRSVVDLLGAVLALSARTRRTVMPQVLIDLDVFAPSGTRAVRVVMGARR